MRSTAQAGIRNFATQRLNPGPHFPAAMDARRRDTILVLLASILWGTSFPGSKLTVGIVDPLFLTFARTALGALLGLAVLAATRRLDLQVFRQPLVWVLGAINAVGFELQNEGILLTTASKTALLVNVNVVIIPLLMVLFFREAMTRLKVTGILIGALGVVVVATKFDPASLAGGQFAGDVLVFVAGVVWAFYVVGAKRMVDRGGDYVALTAGILATTAVLAAIPLFFVGWRSRPAAAAHQSRQMRPGRMLGGSSAVSSQNCEDALASPSLTSGLLRSIDRSMPRMSNGLLVSGPGLDRLFRSFELSPLTRTGLRPRRPRTARYLRDMSVPATVSGERPRTKIGRRSVRLRARPRRSRSQPSRRAAPRANEGNRLGGFRTQRSRSR